MVRFFQEFDGHRSFGRKEVERIVKCSYRNAGNLIVSMKEHGIIETVLGKGKGKYMLSKDLIKELDDVSFPHDVI
jgi:hypothetical protein